MTITVEQTAVRTVVPGLGFPALVGGRTEPRGWPRPGTGASEATGPDAADVSRETVPAPGDEAADDRDEPVGSSGDRAESSHESPSHEPGEIPRDTSPAPESGREDGSVAATNGTVDGSREAPSAPDPAVAARSAGAPAVADVSRETPTLAETGSAAAARAGADRSAEDTPLATALEDVTRRRRAVREVRFPEPAQTRILTVANQKGGVGKTTTTVNIAAAMATSGLRVLVIDLDPQGNASTALAIDHHAEVPSIYDVLVDSRPLTEVVQPCPDIAGLTCAPATLDLAGAEIELVALVARETRLHRAIRTYLDGLTAEQRPHYVLIDCPPSLGLLTVNAFVGADEVFIPIQCEYYALEGLSQLLKNIEMIRIHLNPAIHVSTILLTMYDARTRLSAQVAEEVREHFPAQTLRAIVPRSVRISEAPSHGQTVITYDPHSTGALSYLEAAGEIATRGAPTAADAEPTPQPSDDPRSVMPR